jgi:hypothetical protein
VKNGQNESKSNNGNRNRRVGLVYVKFAEWVDCFFKRNKSKYFEGGDKRKMNKEELIKLSRENLRKSKQGSLCECYDEAFIKGYELSEKRIKELQEENENLKKTYRKQRNKRIDDLQKENAELIKENKVLAQNLEDTEILNKTYEKRFNDLEKENTELKSLKDVADLIRLNNSHIVAMAQLNNNNVALRKENAEREKKYETMCKIAHNRGSFVISAMRENRIFDNQLTNAKEIISEYINILKGDTKNWKKTQEKAEQFLKDCEVEK